MGVFIFVCCLLFVVALMLLNWVLFPYQNVLEYILGFLIFFVVFVGFLWNMHKKNVAKKVIKRQILLFCLIFIPVIGAVFVMNKTMPHMEYLNILAGVLSVFFLYVYFTFESEIITVKKTEIKKCRSGVIKQIVGLDGRCFEVWNGFTRIFKSSIMQAGTGGQYIDMLPRITDEQFKKVKAGQKYRIKTFQLIGANRYIWSMKKVCINRKKLK